jgi:hypothetical protein
MGESGDELLTPLQATTALSASDWESARRVIAKALADGIIDAVAKVVMRDGSRSHNKPIPHAWWKDWSYWDDDSFWETGTTVFPKRAATGYGGQSSGTTTAYGVRLEANGILLLGGKISSPPPKEAKPEKHPGGRPPNRYWEAVLIEVARQLYTGDLQPNKQVDIETAMHDWLVANGHDPGTTQVRERAKLLWAAIQ